MPGFSRSLSFFILTGTLLSGPFFGKVWAQDFVEIPVVVAPQQPKELKNLADAMKSRGIVHAPGGNRTTPYSEIRLAAAHEPQDTSQQLSRNGTNPLRQSDTALPANGRSRLSSYSSGEANRNESRNEASHEVPPALSFAVPPNQVPAVATTRENFPQTVRKQTQPISFSPSQEHASAIPERKQPILETSELRPLERPTTLKTAGFLKKPNELPITKPASALEKEDQGAAEKEARIPDILAESRGTHSDPLTPDSSGTLAGGEPSIMDKLLSGPKEKKPRQPISSAFSKEQMQTISMLGSLSLVLGAFFLFVFFMKKVGPKTGRNLPREAMECIGRFSLNPKLQLNLIRLGNRLILIANTPDGSVETLSEITHPDEVVQILGMCRKLDSNSSSIQFQSVLNEFAKEKTTGGFFGSEIPQRAANSQSQSQSQSQSLASLLAGRQL